MSTQTNYPADTLQHRPYPHLQSDDSKDSCDTLIDVNGLPYTSNSRHQTFTIGTPTTSRLERGFSIPLSKYSSKQSDDTHETSSSQPPVVTHPSEVDVPSLWQRVSRISPSRSVSISHLSYKIVPESIACRFYVATVLIETAIDLAIEGELFMRVRQTSAADDGSQSGTVADVASSKMPVYLSIFALAQ